jgi:hypothetical protein
MECKKALVKCSVIANATIMTDAVANVDVMGGAVIPQSLLLIINSGCLFLFLFLLFAIVLASNSRIIVVLVVVLDVVDALFYVVVVLLSIYDTLDKSKAVSCACVPQS